MVRPGIWNVSGTGPSTSNKRLCLRLCSLLISPNMKCKCCYYRISQMRKMGPQGVKMVSRSPSIRHLGRVGIWAKVCCPPKTLSPSQKGFSRVSPMNDMFRLLFCCFLAVWPWEKWLHLWNFSSFLCEMDVRTVLTLYNYWRGGMQSQMGSVQSSGPWALGHYWTIRHYSPWNL